MEVDFNLQQFLSEMRGEMHDGFNRIDAAAAQVRTDLVLHEKSDLVIAAGINTRLDEIHKFTSGFWWTVRTVIAALVVAGMGLLFAALSR